MSAAVKWRPSSRGHSRFPPHRATASQTTKLPPFEDFINRLAATGITTGCSTNTFCPNDPVTREQMAAFLVRAYAYGDATLDRFVDDESSALENEINRLAAAGITTGCTTDRFCPRDPVLRD